MPEARDDWIGLHVPEYWAPEVPWLIGSDSTYRSEVAEPLSMIGLTCNRGAVGSAKAGRRQRRLEASGALSADGAQEDAARVDRAGGCL